MKYGKFVSKESIYFTDSEMRQVVDQIAEVGKQT